MSGTELATPLAKDKKFRKQLIVGDRPRCRSPKRRASKRIGLVAAVTRLGADKKLKMSCRKMTRNLENAWGASRRSAATSSATSLLVIGGIGGAAVATMKAARADCLERQRRHHHGPSPRTIEESIEVNVPVSVSYNQWTQFEDFPLFMEGVEHVEQIDDTRLHWIAKVGGKTNEWDAKILEQHPDKQISWISEDGKKTRGTVTFEPIGEDKTRITLSMSYQAEGLTETLGSAVGLDQRRVRGDLERFKELIESRGAESGAWRGEVSAGTTK